jgi:hypothetical protein
MVDISDKLATIKPFIDKGLYFHDQSCAAVWQNHARVSSTLWHNSLRPR